MNESKQAMTDSEGEMQRKIDRGIVRSGSYWSNKSAEDHRKMLGDLDEKVLPRLPNESDADYGKRMREYLNIGKIRAALFDDIPALRASSPEAMLELADNLEAALCKDDFRDLCIQYSSLILAALRSSAIPETGSEPVSDEQLEQWVQWLDWDTGLSTAYEIKQLRSLLERIGYRALPETREPVDNDKLAAWHRNWHWADCAEDRPVDLTIYPRDMRMLKAFVAEFGAAPRPSPDGAGRDATIAECAKIADVRAAEVRVKAQGCKSTPSAQSWFARSIEARCIADKIRALVSQPPQADGLLVHRSTEVSDAPIGQASAEDDAL